MAVRHRKKGKRLVGDDLAGHCGAGPVICTLMPVASEVLLGDRVRT